jgi:hypothetical protein
MAKKLLPLISILMIVAFALTACAKPTVAPTKAPVVTEAPTEAPTVAPVPSKVVIWHSKQSAENDALNLIKPRTRILRSRLYLYLIMIFAISLKPQSEPVVARQSYLVPLIGALHLLMLPLFRISRQC